MTHVLVLITVFSVSNGVHSQTRFQEFGSGPACEAAAQALRDGMRDLKGTMGRKVIAQCHSLR